jgi:hypothetical protein
LLRLGLIILQKPRCKSQGFIILNLVCRNLKIASLSSTARKYEPDGLQYQSLTLPECFEQKMAIFQFPLELFQQPTLPVAQLYDFLDGTGIMNKTQMKQCFKKFQLAFPITDTWLLK